MNRILIVSTALSLVLFLPACSVKEDRRPCPCYLSVQTDQSYGALHDDSAVLSVTESTAGVLIHQDRYDISKIDELPLSKGILQVGALWGLRDASISGRECRVPLGSEVDSLFAGCVKGVDARGEQACVRIPDHKQFATIHLSLVLKSSEEQYPYEIRVRGSVDGFDLLSLEPLQGDYEIAPRMSTPDGSNYSFRVPRQLDDSLVLEFWKKGTLTTKAKDDGPEDSLVLGQYISQMGYDWTAESLEDIAVTIDYARARLEITVNDWEGSWIYSLEI